MLFSISLCPQNGKGSQGSTSPPVSSEGSDPSHHPVILTARTAEELLGISHSLQVAGRRTQVQGISNPTRWPAASLQIHQLP